MGKVKIVYLGDQDEDVIIYLDGLKNFSCWVRKKARGDIVKQKTGVDPEVAAYIERVLEAKLAGCTLSSERQREKSLDIDNVIKRHIDSMF